MHLDCPHCRNPIEIAEPLPEAEVNCPSCGSSFSLEERSTKLWVPIKRLLGKFQLLQVIGQGAFGTVYKARDTELDRFVAIKIPRSSNLPDGDDLARFLREARSVAQLRHESIVSVHDAREEEGVPFLVSDFVEGLTLSDISSARSPTSREAAEWIAAIAEALHYAHENGVVHRDIKPSNIIIRSDGTPCVMDFGLAKRDAGEITITIEGQILGTPAYMSPEQARGDSHRVDRRSDIYSLGVVLYRLLTGELPFRGTTRMLLHQVQHEDPRPPRQLNDLIPRDLETICLKVLAKEPERRFSTAQALACDLRRWLERKPILARPVGKLERSWRRCKRNVAAAITLGIVGLAVAVTITALAFAVKTKEEAARREQLHRITAERDAVRKTMQQLLTRLDASLQAVLIQEPIHNHQMFQRTGLFDEAADSRLEIEHSLVRLTSSDPRLEEAELFTKDGDRIVAVVQGKRQLNNRSAKDEDWFRTVLETDRHASFEGNTTSLRLSARGVDDQHNTVIVGTFLYDCRDALGESSHLIARHKDEVAAAIQDFARKPIP